MCFITFIIPIMANYFICVLNQNKADTQNDRIMKEVHSYIRAQKYIESVAKKNYKNNIKPTKEYKHKKVDNNNYTQLRNLITISCKQKQISRQSILSFVEELNKVLGNNVNHYSKMTFENDLHEIYEGKYDTDVKVRLIEEVRERTIDGYTYNEYTKETFDYMWAKKDEVERIEEVYYTEDGELMPF